MKAWSPKTPRQQFWAVVVVLTFAVVFLGGMIYLMVFHPEHLRPHHR